MIIKIKLSYTWGIIPMEGKECITVQNNEDQAQIKNNNK